MSLIKAIESLRVAESVLEKVGLASNEALAERFSEERYMAEGPDKDDQEEDQTGSSIIGMYSDWADEILDEADVKAPASQQVDRLLSEAIYEATYYGMIEPKKAAWDAYFPGTVPLKVVRGLSSSPPDQEVVRELIEQIKPGLSLLLEAGLEPGDLVKVVQETAVEGVQTA